MKRLVLLTVSVILAGTVMLYVSGINPPHVQDATPERTEEDTNNAVLITDSTSKVTAGGSAIPKTRNQDGLTTSLEHYAHRLESTKGKKLIESLESFWHTCLSQSNCEDSLLALRQIVPPKYFEFVKSYPELSRLWQQRLGTLVFESNQSLTSRIAQFKHQAKLVWGEWAEVLLSDEFAAYDFQLKQQDLTLESPAQYREAFEALLEASQEHDLGLNTDEARFEEAASSLPDSMSEDEKSAFIAELERTYLSPQQREDIRNRERQVTTQQNRVRDYHIELNQLESQLSQQRQTDYAGLTDAEWQTLYQQKISEFRQRFFASNNS
ncbi:chromosome partitioning protein ParA [Vibrio maritimus]|uniref:chromosome partitioning protein ParA n=1 Tax=Vibrio maritimus TaxID=990268 RepID=UPI00373669E0